jgi:NUMOD3 motif
MIIPYVYYIKNKVTNEFYYGSRFGNVKHNRTPEEDFWIHYFTSSKRVGNLIEIYGASSFEFEILFRSHIYDQCYWVEQQFIKEHRKNCQCLNGTYVDPNTSERKFSSYGITQEKLQARGEAISASKAGKGNFRLGRPHTEQTKENMRIAQAKIHYTHSEETRNKMKEYKRTAEHSAKLGDVHRGKPWTINRRNAQKGKL